MAQKRYSERKREEKEGANRQAAGVILIIVSAFLLLCTITRGLILGNIGTAIYNVSLGLLGYSIYPILLFVLLLGIVKTQKKSLSVSAGTAVWIAFLAIIVVLIANLISSAKYLGNGFSSFIENVWDNKNTVGGVAFGVINYGLYALVRIVFSYIILALLALMALFFITGLFTRTPLGKKSAGKRKQAAAKRSNPFVYGGSSSSFGSDDRAYGDSRSGGGLFVGTIHKKERDFAQSGSFDELVDEKEAALEQPKPAFASEEAHLTDEEYNRKRAHEILFGDTEAWMAAYNQPRKVVAAPDVHDSTATEAKPSADVKPGKIQSAPVLPTKPVEINYNGSPIINGDAVSENLKNEKITPERPSALDAANKAAAERSASEVKSDTSYYTRPSAFTSTGEQTYTASSSSKGTAPGPIINGDMYVSGEKPPVVDFGYDEPTQSQPAVNNEPAANESDEQKQTNDTSQYGYEVTYEDDEPEYDDSSYEKPEQPQVDNGDYYTTEQADEESDDASFDESEADDVSTEPEKSPFDIAAEQINSYGQNDNIVDALESESIEFETEAPVDKDLAAADEEADNDTAEPEADEVDENSDETDDEPVAEAEPDIEVPESDESEPGGDDIEAVGTEAVTETEAEVKADEENELSKSFEANTTSFVISDEVEDHSEKTYSNPNDTTGYYNQVRDKSRPEPVPVEPERKSFEERVVALDNRMNKNGTIGGQIDIDTVAKRAAMNGAVAAPAKPKPKKRTRYVAPPIDLLVTESTHPEISEGDTQNKIAILENALEELGVPAKVNGVTVGPAITRYELDMPPGMSVKKIENLSSDIRYNLACKGQIRIESPIPGKRAVGIELPNDQIYTVALKDIISSSEFKASPSPLTIALGKDIQGKVMLARLEKMPHLLIAGTTGSGKSSCLNSLLISLLYKSSPDDVRIILIDPKQVEFTAYNGVPHMMIPKAITDVNQAINAFKWASNEMERRYGMLSENQVRDIQEYNSMAAVKEGTLPKMPFIVLVVDEFANLITSSSANRNTLESLIMAIASKARAAGIHLVLATQRPSVDVITGTIKANLPSRIAFSVSSAQNSRIILDNTGAETLRGRGDMLFAPLGESDEIRIQGAYVDNNEVKDIVTFVKEHNSADFDSEFQDAIVVKDAEKGSDESGQDDGGYDNELIDVVRTVIRSGTASASYIQRRFRYGWNKAARIMEQMEELGFIGKQNGAKPREVFITKEKFKEFFGEDYE